jgi:hypothetical protein
MVLKGDSLVLNRVILSYRDMKVYQTSAVTLKVKDMGKSCSIYIQRSPVLGLHMEESLLIVSQHFK